RRTVRGRSALGDLSPQAESPSGRRSTRAARSGSAGGRNRIDGGVGRDPLLRCSPPRALVSASPDLLALPGELRSVGVVGRLYFGLRVRPLVRRARAGVDVPAGDRVARVAVD